MLKVLKNLFKHRDPNFNQVKHKEFLQKPRTTVHCSPSFTEPARPPGAAMRDELVLVGKSMAVRCRWQAHYASKQTRRRQKRDGWLAVLLFCPITPSSILFCDCAAVALALALQHKPPYNLPAPNTYPKQLFGQ